MLPPCLSESLYSDFASDASAQLVFALAVAAVFECAQDLPVYGSSSGPPV